MDRSLKFLKDLVEAHGAPGFEGDVSKIMAGYLKGVGPITKDRLGSFICEKKGTTAGPRVMLAGHLDEVGFLVKSVTKEGFVKFLPLGGWWGHVVLGQRLIIKTRKGDVIGVVGSKPPHELMDEDRKKVLEIRHMYIDVGATSDWDVKKKLDIRPGDPILPDSSFAVMANPNLLLAKAWDNRIGCAIAADVALRLKGQSHPNTVYAVATVQEEVGLRGAQTSAFSVNPDVAFALDVGIAHDTPGTEGDEKLGGGPLIVIYDASAIPNRALRDLVIDTAERLKMPLQFESVERGGTDAGRIHVHGRGVPTLSLGVAARYIHSHVSIIDRRDYEATVKLMVAVVKRLDAKTVDKLI
ncbi:MAG: M42 family metallopeptidase [Candidatus Eisenbacteria bacterium]|uniref:M42 family metallopeptidase n=1 Tax=Eiseniibacteriota bacterium TaxID=2212470 RepID=A0A849SDK2_UNCEI|nr:M42 family metallopeptidase [Candidatus Eisenbacteria bacterium]